jgi:hypothetical protein
MGSDTRAVRYRPGPAGEDTLLTSRTAAKQAQSYAVAAAAVDACLLGDVGVV